MGARTIADLVAWYEARWAESIDFKNDLIDLLDASKFGGKEYTPYQVYIKALYEYFKDEFGADAPEFGRMRRRSRRVPGGLGEESPPNSPTIRRSADCRLRGTWEDLDRQETA